jgi:DNA-3-methyladenine glycosylase
MLSAADFDRPALELAPELIGAVLLVDGVGGRIVEVEAYRPDDPASHSFSGPTPRNASMFAGPGRAYVYRSYGIHWCLNFTAWRGSAVLIRALEPLAGLELMAERRGASDPRLLCSGPGRLSQALGITRELDGLMLDQPPFAVSAAEATVEIVTGPRIGITKAMDEPWRFGLSGSRFVSRPFRQGGREPASPAPVQP